MFICILKKSTNIRLIIMLSVLYIWVRGIYFVCNSGYFFFGTVPTPMVYFCFLFFSDFWWFILYFTVETTTHTTVSTIDRPADPALIAVIVSIACISLTLTIICLLHWQRHRLGLKCSLRQQTTDTQFHDIS